MLKFFTDKRVYILYFLMAVALFTSCITAKKTNYLQIPPFIFQNMITV